MHRKTEKPFRRSTCQMSAGKKGECLRSDRDTFLGFCAVVGGATVERFMSVQEAMHAQWCVVFESNIWFTVDIHIHMNLSGINEMCFLLFTPTNAQHIYMNNILYIICTATCFDSSASS